MLQVLGIGGFFWTL